jgi:hypothetical protein
VKRGGVELKYTALAVLVMFLGACSPQEKQQTRVEAHKAGEAVKKELKNDAKFVKEEALKARAEAQKDVKKVKNDLNSKDDKSADDSRDR